MSGIHKPITLSAAAAFLSLIFLLFQGESFYDPKLFLGIFSVYAVVFFLLGVYFWRRHKSSLIAAIFGFLTIVQVPIVIYQLQKIFSLWKYDTLDYNFDSAFDWCHTGLVVMEVSTTLMACLVLAFIRIPILSPILYLLLWTGAVDNIPRLFPAARSASVLLREAQASVILGIMLVAFGYFLDRKKEKDFALWAYFFGTFFFWIGLLHYQMTSPTLRQFFCLCIGVAMVFLSLHTKRRVLLVFGHFSAYHSFLLLIPLSQTLWSTGIIVGIGLISFGFLLHFFFMHKLPETETEANAPIP